MYAVAFSIALLILPLLLVGAFLIIFEFSGVHASGFNDIGSKFSPAHAALCAAWLAFAERVSRFANDQFTIFFSFFGYRVVSDPSEVAND